MPSFMGGDTVIRFIKKEEGLRLTDYADAGQRSVGYGHLIKRGEEHLLGRKISQDEAEELLMQDIASHQTYIKKHLKVPISDEKMAALTSIAYNTGAASKATRGAVERLNEGREDELPEFLARFNTSQGVALPVLTRRRATEAAMLMKKDGGLPVASPPNEKAPGIAADAEIAPRQKSAPWEVTERKFVEPERVQEIPLVLRSSVGIGGGGTKEEIVAEIKRLQHQMEIVNFEINEKNNKLHERILVGAKRTAKYLWKANR